MINLLHDCDPGNDDAVAILAAIGHPALNLLAVTTGAGHLSADRTAVNGTIAVAAAAPFCVPVCAGAQGPLVRERLIARLLDMDSALDPVRDDLDRVSLAEDNSVDRIAAEVQKNSGLTIVTTGPLTNLAMVLQRYPEIHGQIGRIVSLAGAWGLGTKTAAAEWNILCDPEAAAIVFNSGIGITLVPVDASGCVPINQALIQRVALLEGRAAKLAAELLRSLTTTHSPGIMVPEEAPLHDPCAILVAAQADIATTVPARVDVDTTVGINYGRTVIDFAGRSNLPNNCDVVVKLDIEATHDALVLALATLAAGQKPEAQMSWS